ncbi:hypothetical protein EG329_012603 [Mollisiaceae sp. DMI_Dod_QoI]|nr:hypothetical protein EG329_012603 [Helotiales sp. DMI_Dod_QoI]
MSPSQQRPLKYKPWDGDIQQLECIGSGVSSLVFAIDKQRVAKISVGTPQSIEDIDRERAVYRRFKENPGKSECRYILSCFEIENARGLVLERCQGTLRSYIRSNSPIPHRLVLKWARQVAEGLAFVHGCQVIQGDVGCHNILLDSKNNIKLADFAGSAIDQLDASVNYEVRSRLPGITRPTKQSDIFAFGSAFYELATGSTPYAGKSYTSVQNMYKNKKFPEDVDGISYFGPTIRKCWQQGFKSGKDVMDALGRIVLPQTESKSDQDPLVLEAPGHFLARSLESSVETSSRTPRRYRKPPNTPSGPPTFRHHSEVERVTRRRTRKSKIPELKWLNKFILWTRAP